jgi:hypothetical protein
MNKTLYWLAIFFLAIAVVAGIFHSVLLVRQGFSLADLQSYATWFLIFNLVYLAGHLFVLRYFHSKQWKFMVITGVVTIILFVIQFLFQYYVLVHAARELVIIYSILALIYLIAGIVFAVGLIFSLERRHGLLRSLGIVMLLNGILLLICLFAGQLGLPSTLALNGVIWLGMFSNVFPIFFIVTFIHESNKISTTVRPSGLQETFYYGTGALGMIAIVSLLSVGGQLGMESYWDRDWQRRGPEEAKKLAKRFEDRIFVNDQSDTLHYLLLRPFDYDSTQKYPIVTCLHGGPTRIAGNVEVTQPAPLLSEPFNQKKYPAFLFVPQGRPGVLWGGIPGVPSMETLVLNAMTELEHEFNIDEKRRYVAGISGGGYGTWHFITTHPDLFAAAIPICGSGNPALAKNITHIPVWAFHGNDDRNVSVTGSRNMIEAMRSAGGNPRYNEFPGVGHNVWPEVEKTEGVMDWMFAQRRN